MITRHSSQTSEVVSETGTEAGFPLKYKTKWKCQISIEWAYMWFLFNFHRQACSIQFEDQVIVTGGLNTNNKVSVYTDDGWIQDLAPFKHGRWGHSCGHYTSDDDIV